MTTNININLLTVTPQRNANTLVQASTIASSNGPLAEVLNNQAVRTVKGTVVFSGTGGSGNAVVLNNYDGSPLCFASGDIVVAMALANGSTVYTPTSPYNFPLSFSSSGRQTVTVQFSTANEPELNESTSIWAPGADGQNLTNAISLLDLYPQPSSPPAYGTNPPLALNVSLSSNNGIGTQGNSNPNAVWMNCTYVGIPAALSIGVAYAVNITMLVLNPHLAQ
jgi:hypothetical protein